MTSRREFLEAVAIVLLSGKLAYDTFLKIEKNYQKKFIYNELPKHTHMITEESVLDAGDYIIDAKVKGVGIVLKDYFITCQHNRNDGIVDMQTLFGPIPVKCEVTERKFYVNDQEVKELYSNKLQDIAIFENPGLDPFPFEPTIEHKLGEEVYIIGNPKHQGTNIRKATISDKDGIGNIPSTYFCFGIDQPLIPGDSGSPIVSLDKLHGIATSVYQGALGYVKNIETYLHQIDKLVKE